MSLHAHKNPKPEQTASAPYNFIPLPERIVLVDHLPGHDTYAPGRYTGYFQVDLTTMSPLYIRGMLTAEESMQTDATTAEFFHKRSPDEPVIPGSSLRGMLRHMVEIITYSKISKVMERQLFFRNISISYYRDQLLQNGNYLGQTGYLRFSLNPKRYEIVPCHMVRVPRSMLGPILEGDAQNQTPRWDSPFHQHQTVYVKVQGKTVTDIRETGLNGFEEGTLVISGHIGGKEKEFVFINRQEERAIPVSDDVIKQFNADTQISAWQEDAFPTDKPNNVHRPRPGTVPDDESYRRGEPVFYCLNPDGTVRFFGRAMMFRLPYKHRPNDLIPEPLRQEHDLDYAHALFGFTEKKEVGPDKQEYNQYAGRVFVTDAILTQKPDQLFMDTLIPRILASPKPTTFAHYLVQSNFNPDNFDAKDLSHYDSPVTETTIRGFKRYWPQQTANGRSLGEWATYIRDHDDTGRPLTETTTQHTRLRPLAPGATFGFKVHFENLSMAKLGALCWAIQPLGEPDRTYVHQLGMGKPLGMGSVSLKAHLHLSDRKHYEPKDDQTGRYDQLFSGTSWHEPSRYDRHDLSNRAFLKIFVRIFETHILESLQPVSELRNESETIEHLHQLKRIRMLLRMMEWPGQPAELNGALYLSSENRPNTRYMKLDEFNKKHVLPTPEIFPILAHPRENRDG